MIDGKRWTIIFVGIFGALAILPLLFVQVAYIQSVLFLVYMSAALAGSWNLLGGYAGQFSVGHSIFFGFGAYATAFLYARYGVSPWVGMAFGALISTAFSLTVGRILLRLHLHFFALSTIALLLVFTGIATHWVGLTGGAVGISLPFVPGFVNLNFVTIPPYVYLALALLVVVTVSSLFIKNSRMGFYFQAVREDERAASALGVSVQYHKTLALAISSIFPAIGGALFVMYSGYVTPSFAFSLDRSINMVLFPIVGGIGTVIGPLLGTFILVPIIEYLRGLLGGQITGLDYVIYGIILVVIILRIPQGIMGLSIFRFGGRERSSNSGTGASELSPGKKTGESPPHSRLSRASCPIPPRDDSRRQEKTKRRLLQVTGITKRFGGLVALNDVSFEIDEGMVFGLIGPNGAGKSTLFNVVNGFYRPDEGRVEFAGTDISAMSPHVVCKLGIGRTFQHVRPLRGLTTLQNIMVGSFLRYRAPKDAMERAIHVMEFLNMQDARDRLAADLDIFDQKKLEIGKALAGDVALLLLDEIAAGLNPSEMDQLLGLLQSISETGITLFLIEHRMKAVMSISDRILVIDHGKRLFEGTPREVCEHEGVIEAYLGQRPITDQIDFKDLEEQRQE